MIGDMLKAFQRFTGPLAIAEALRAAGARDLEDVALLEYFIFKQSWVVDELVAWVEAWPMLGRWGKPHVTAGDIVPRLDRLVDAGLLVRREQAIQLTPRALECFPVLLPRAARATEIALDVQRVVSHLRLGRAEVAAAQIAEHLGNLLDPNDDVSAAEVAVELAALRPASALLAEALLFALVIDSATQKELRQALAALRVDLTHPAREQGPSDGSVVRWGVLRFADNIASYFDVRWLGDGSTTRNHPRCEWLVRSFAAYLGVAVHQGGLHETPLESARKLLTLDHRREKLFNDEAEYQKGIVSLAEKRLQAEQSRRDEAAKAAAEAAAKAAQDPSYASGRRE